jgi:hypothetical protein
MSIAMSAIAELRRGRGPGIFAVTCRGGRWRKPIRLPDGAIVEVPDPDCRAELRDPPRASIGVAIDGRPAQGHHACLGLVAAHAPLAGVFLLPSGELAAIYGAEVAPIG